MAFAEIFASRAEAFCRLGCYCWECHQNILGHEPCREGVEEFWRLMEFFAQEGVLDDFLAEIHEFHQRWLVSLDGREPGDYPDSWWHSMCRYANERHMTDRHPDCRYAFWLAHFAIHRTFGSVYLA